MVIETTFRTLLVTTKGRYNFKFPLEYTYQGYERKVRETIYAGKLFVQIRSQSIHWTLQRK